MADLGTFALALGLAAAAWAVVAIALGLHRGRPELVASGEGAVRAFALAVSVACTVLLVALLSRDFSVVYVAEHTSRNLSLAYTVSAFWAGQGGSLLLWTALLCGAGVLLIGPRRDRLWIGPAAGAVIAAVAMLFAVLVLMENPFRSGPAPADGQGLNPLLQNYAQLLHPVATYAGFVGFTVPIALLVAALLPWRGSSPRGDWVRVADAWTLGSWTALTLGIVLGARWAYSELGWGGYWGWDPVENASLLPWLTGTALLHTGVADRRTGRVRLGGAVLALTTFVLCVFGTFLTRSGVVSSVHAFGESAVGPVLGAGVLLALVACGGLLVWRLPDLTAASRDRHRRLTRSWLVLLLSVVGVAVFWGTLFPVVVRGVNGHQVSVGRRFFEISVTPAGLALLAVFAFAPVITAAAGRDRWRTAGLLAGGAAALAVGVTALSGTGHPLVAMVIGLAGAGVVSAGRKLVAAARSAASPVGAARAAAPYLAHLGVVVMLAAVAVNSAYQRQARVELSVGRTAVAGSHRVTLEELTAREGTDRVTFLARVRVAPVTGDGGVRVDSRQVAFAGQEQPTAEVGIRAGWTGDLYVVLEAADVEARTATVTVFDNLAVPWIWAGGWLLLVAAVAAALPGRWPGRAAARQPQAREAGEPAVPVAAAPVGGDRTEEEGQ